MCPCLLILYLLVFMLPVSATPVPRAVQDALNLELRQSHIIQRKPPRIQIKAIQNQKGYEAVVGAYVFKIAADGRYITRTTYSRQQWRALPTTRQRALRRHALSTLDERGMIIFLPPNRVRYTVTAFVDIDGAATAKLHRQLNTLLDAGVKVRYVAFPRAEIGSNRYKRTVSVWCAKNRQAAITTALHGKKIPPQHCRHAIKAHYAVAHSINATQRAPTLILENGDMFVGYMDAHRILQKLRK